MKLLFPSREFDEAVAAVCHGSGSEELMRALNELLRSNAAARDEYIVRVELHARLSSDPALFVDSIEAVNFARAGGMAASQAPNIVPLRNPVHSRRLMVNWITMLAACVLFVVNIYWGWTVWQRDNRGMITSKSVAMLHRVADARWDARGVVPQPGAPLAPGLLRLESGLAQLVFYSGVRVVMEGPAELELVQADEAVCLRGRLVAEVPPQARGFRINTPQARVTDLGTVFGVEVKHGLTDVHVFKGRVEVQTTAGKVKQLVQENAAASVESSGVARQFAAEPSVFASLFALQDKSTAAEALRFEQWRMASQKLNADQSLLLHLDFEHASPSDWRLRNMSRSDLVPDATIVGGQWVEGRWPGKSALEFRGVSDRVRLSVPGDYESLTLAAWVRVQGLDRRVNSLFMSDAFEPGTLHWLILNDGAPTVTVVGQPGNPLQIVTGPPVMTLDKFGMWQHVAVVVDSGSGQVVHYLNGHVVSETPLKIKPPFRVGTAELGNWNAKEFKGDESLMIRNFSGAMDEFCLFSRALSAEEIRALYSQGKPQMEPVASRK
jgi:hypothetical protein